MTERVPTDAEVQAWWDRRPRGVVGVQVDFADGTSNTYVTDPDVKPPEHDPRVATWADGFGRWYARVPRHAAGPVVAARHAIRDELLARNNEVARHHWLHLERAENYDTDDTVVYREPTTTTDECPSCATDREKD